MSDNPYRFTVKVIYGYSRWIVWLSGSGLADSNMGFFGTEAEANLHADLILRALREAGREG